MAILAVWLNVLLLRLSFPFTALSVTSDVAGTPMAWCVCVCVRVYHLGSGVFCFTGL